MTLYERFMRLADEYEMLGTHYKELNRILCRLVLETYGKGLTSPEGYQEFQRLMKMQLK